MNFTPQQDRALQMVREWLRGPDQVFSLGGYAGTGKTTLAKHFAEGVDGDVIFATYTGKAAYVMRSKGCEGARTIHSLIYRPKDRPTAKLIGLEAALAKIVTRLERMVPPDTRIHLEREQRSLEHRVAEERERCKQPAFEIFEESELHGAALLILDECSMIDERMAQDLLSFKVKILVLGDPAQLPPVRGGGYFTSQQPDYVLTEVHRQAAESGILRLATAIRQHGVSALRRGNYGDCRVMGAEDMVVEDALTFDQVLVGMNKTRHRKNARWRAALGVTEPFPVDGDKLVCLRNNREAGLLNGSLWMAEKVYGHDDQKVAMDLKSIDGSCADVSVVAHAAYFNGTADKLGPWDMRKNEHFDFGYALTVHKSQGSQWGKVLLYDESRRGPWPKSDAAKHLYTGVTRAADKLVVVV